MQAPSLPEKSSVGGGISLPTPALSSTSHHHLAAPEDAETKRLPRADVLPELSVQGAQEGCPAQRLHRPGLQHRGRRRRRGDLRLVHPGGRPGRPEWGAEARRPDLVGKWTPSELQDGSHVSGFKPRCDPRIPLELLTSEMTAEPLSETWLFGRWLNSPFQTARAR